MLNLVLFVDGSSNKKIASAAQPGTTLSQEIHHHHETVLIQKNVLHINSLTLEPAQHKPEHLSHDADNLASKLFIYSHRLAISCDTLSDPSLRKHAIDFKQLVNIKTLALVLFQNELLTSEDMEHLQLPTIIESEKVDYVYFKMLHLREEEYKKFLNCLMDPHATQHCGHKRLHEILSTSQQ